MYSLDPGAKLSKDKPNFFLVDANKGTGIATCIFRVSPLTIKNTLKLYSAPCAYMVLYYNRLGTHIKA